MLEGWGVEPGSGVIAMEARSASGRGVSVDCGGWTKVLSSGVPMPGGVMSVENGDVGREVRGVDSSEDIVASLLSSVVFVY